MSKTTCLQYEMIVDGCPKFIPFREAYVLYDCGHRSVAFGSLVVTDDLGTTRPMTNEERNQIANAADRYSESK